MKGYFAKIVMLGVLIAFNTSDADAQRGGSRRKPNPGDTTKQQQQVVNNNTAPAYNPYANVPIIVDSSGFTNTDKKPSLRNDNAFDKGSITARTPLPYEHIRWDDVLYAEKVWREIDLREKMNLPFESATTVLMRTLFLNNSNVEPGFA